MVSEGVKIRAQIDTESVRSVMLVNGGGSVALLALLPAILGTPLVFPLFLTLAVWLFGLTLAVTHSVLRRKCSSVHEKCDMAPPHGKPRLRINPKQPWICWWCWQCLYASIVAFLIGGVLMVFYGLANLDVLSAKPEPPPNQTTKVRMPQNNSPQLDALTRAAGLQRQVYINQEEIMAKEITTEDELKNMIQEKVNNCEELDGDCKGVIINSVYWRELDEAGSNWDVHSLRNAAGCEGVVRGIIFEFKQKYNLKDQ